MYKLPRGGSRGAICFNAYEMSEDTAPLDKGAVHQHFQRTRPLAASAPIELLSFRCRRGARRIGTITRIIDQDIGLNFQHGFVPNARHFL